MRITPSILNADFAHLADEVGRINDADAVHVDVMDNHFVPNLSIGLPVVESLRKATDKMLDIHLMIQDPDRWAPAYAEAGAESVPTGRWSSATAALPANCAPRVPARPWRSSPPPRSTRMRTCWTSWTWCC